MAFNLAKLCTVLAMTMAAHAAVHAADVTVTPAASSGFVVKDASGVNERLRVQESGAISLPGVPGAAAQSTGLCMSGAGLLGPCGSGSSSGAAYSASTGLDLAGTAFSVAPTYQLPQGCAATQIPQWNGTTWACASASASGPTYTASSGLNLTGTAFSVAPAYQLPQGCAATQIAQWNGTVWTCASSSASGSTYTAAAGLNLTGTAFSVAPTYQLPQTCTATQFAQWNGTAWACASSTGGGATLPAGTYEQTLRYNSTNTLVANSLLLAYADGGLVAGGSAGTGTIPTTGAGTRLMWYPNKSALRAGHVGGTEWDDANVGQNSIGLGSDTKASGVGSIATGSFTTASGGASTAMGAATTASGGQATALGDSTTAGGTDSTAMGGSTTASGDWSTAMGNATSASGKYSTAMGQGTTASGYASIAMGESSSASGDNSIAMGFSANTNGHSGSFVFSDGTPAANDANNQFLVQASGGMKILGGGLTILGSALQLGNYGSFFDYNNAPTSLQCDSCDLLASVYAPNGDIVATGFDALSDARIKDIAGVSNSAHDLDTLDAIQITDYRMKDRARYGDRRHKKVIAQQVEKVFPQLVTKHTDFIPDVYEVASRIEQVEGGYKLGFDMPHGLAETAKKLKLLPEGKTVFEQVDIVSVPSPREVIVRASGWTAEHVFVFGEQVDDLRTVDYEGLSALNVSATQELSKRLDLQQTRQSQLVAQLADKDAQLVQLQERLGAQQQQLDAERDELASQRVRIAALQTQEREIAALKAAVANLQRKPVDALFTAAAAQP